MPSGTQARPWRPGSFEEWVTYAPTEYLKCWDQGHRFTEWLGENAEWDARDGSCMLYQVCPQCGLPRDRWIGARGEIDGARNVYYYHRMELHDYPYLFHADGVFTPDVKAKRARIRLELVRRELEHRAVPKAPGGHRTVVPIRPAAG